jgi:4-azaleucine resistance transporter AzlC
VGTHDLRAVPGRMTPVTAADDDPAPTATIADGVRAIVPLLIGVVPFGLVAGLTAVQTGQGWLGAVVFSVVVYAGAAQLAALDLLGGGASVLVVVLTALVINSRYVLYSASLAPSLSGVPRARRILGSYLLTDQGYAVSLVRFRAPVDAPGRWRFYLGASTVMWATWQVSTLLGALVGGAVPSEVPLSFAVPLAFLALLVPVVTDTPTALAAVVSGVVVVVAYPLGTGAFPLAAVCGIAAGATLALLPRRTP